MTRAKCHVRIHDCFSEIEGAHNLEDAERDDIMVVDQSDDVGGSAGEIITALRCKLKDVERQSSKSKCLICMVSKFTVLLHEDNMSLVMRLWYFSSSVN